MYRLASNPFRSTDPRLNQPATQPNQSRCRRYVLLPEAFFSVFVLLFVTIRLLQQHAEFLLAPGADWNSSEWMIDYAAGFVRRGFGGELLKWLMHLTGLAFFPLWAAFATSIYLAVCCQMLRRCRRLGGPAFWRFCLLFNPALLIFPLECRLYGSFLRKEMLYIAATAFLVTLCERVLRRATDPLLVHALPVLLIGCALSTFLALMHEGMFLFEWFPLNFVLLLAFLLRLRKGKLVAASIVLLISLPALAVTAASFHWHGDVLTGLQICESWHAESIPTVCVVNTARPSQFDAIGWTASRVAHDTLLHAWRFPIFILLFVFLAAVELATIRRLMPNAQLAHLAAILTLPLVVALPIFLSNDWGRYLFTITGQQIFIILSNDMRPAVFDVLPQALREAITRWTTPQQLRLDKLAGIVESHSILFGLILLLLPVPDTMPERTLYLQSPPAILYDFAIKIHAGTLP